MIRPRSAWARDLRPTAPLDVERPEDVRFLLVHHTASPNGYDEADVPALLRSFYTMHVGPERRWPDIAYNFLIDAYGGVWEGREGSATMAVKASATGGSQGFAMLCCYIGEFTSREPTPAAEGAMLRLLALLADRYEIDTAPGAVTTFLSRGSNRHPAGTSVTTRTISGHRDMSQTACPGDTVYAAMRTRYQAQVTALRSAVTTPPSASPTPSAAAPAATASATPAGTPAGTPAPAVSASPEPAASPSSDVALQPTATDDGLDIPRTTAIAGAAAGLATTIAAVLLRGERKQPGPRHRA